MRQGNKKIFHLEAWVIKVMSIYKVRVPLTAVEPKIHYFISISYTISTWMKTFRRDHFRLILHLYLTHLSRFLTLLRMSPSTAMA